MKLVIVIVVIVILLQAATLGMGLSGGGMDKPGRDEIEDGDWDPKEKVPEAGFLDGLLEPFRPRLELPWKDKAFGGEAEQVVFDNGHADGRVAKFELVSGTGVRIHYGCVGMAPGLDDCTQTVCLCGAGFTDLQSVSDCTKQKKCMATGEIVVYSESGTLEFTGVGEQGGTVTQQ
jgi:hypothetical protein